MKNSSLFIFLEFLKLRTFFICEITGAVAVIVDALGILYAAEIKYN
jgi:hypothetical protein